MRAANAGFVDDAGIFHVIARVAENRNNRVEAVGVVVNGKLLVVFVGDDWRLGSKNMVNLTNTIRTLFGNELSSKMLTLLSVRLSKAWNGMPMLCFVCWH